MNIGILSDETDLDKDLFRIRKILNEQLSANYIQTIHYGFTNTIVDSIILKELVKFKKPVYVYIPSNLKDTTLWKVSACISKVIRVKILSPYKEKLAIYSKAILKKVQGLLTFWNGLEQQSETYTILQLAKEKKLTLITEMIEHVH